MLNVKVISLGRCHRYYTDKCYYTDNRLLDDVDHVVDIIIILTIHVNSTILMTRHDIDGYTIQYDYIKMPINYHIILWRTTLACESRSSLYNIDNNTNYHDIIQIEIILTIHTHNSIGMIHDSLKHIFIKMTH